MIHKSEKCAEVLVPDNVDPQYIIGTYVANQTALLVIFLLSKKNNQGNIEWRQTKKHKRG